MYRCYGVFRYCYIPSHFDGLVFIREVKGIQNLNYYPRGSWRFADNIDSHLDDLFVRDVTSLRQLTAFLITNIGNLVSANKLVGMFGIKSPATFFGIFFILDKCLSA